MRQVVELTNISPKPFLTLAIHMKKQPDSPMLSWWQERGELLKGDQRAIDWVCCFWSSVEHRLLLFQHWRRGRRSLECSPDFHKLDSWSSSWELGLLLFWFVIFGRKCLKERYFLFKHLLVQHNSNEWNVDLLYWNALGKFTSSRNEKWQGVRTQLTYKRRVKCFKFSFLQFGMY